jgi:lipopolysaccharide/colanic/teichoic acid biosynthesis glycosyltransferase
MTRPARSDVAATHLTSIPAIEPLVGTTPSPSRNAPQPPQYVSAMPLRRRWSSGGKRIIDVVGAFIGLLVLAPVFLGLVIAVRLDSPGPVLFRHERVGRNGTRFRCLKFRTMVIDAEQRLQELLASDAEAAEQYARNFKLRADPRVTSIGRWLRRTSLDELPQLWNVLRGEMSLVGPRPVVEAELEKYGAAQTLVFSVRPGLTGSWQVSGRNNIDYDARVSLDVAYVTQMKLRTDVAIIARTVLLMLAFGRNGAY